MICLSACLVLVQLAAPAAASFCIPAAQASAPRDEKVLKALEAWLKAYRAGKVDFVSKEELGKNSIGEKLGVLPKGFVGRLTAQRELELMLEEAVKLESAAAAEIVLQVAAIGLDQAKFQYKPEMAPYAVRSTAEMWLNKFTSAEATGYVTSAARGEAKLDKTYGSGVRAAALRSLGARKDAGARVLLQEQLGAGEWPIRLAAAESLAQLADEAAAEPLAAALERETHEVVLGSIVQALRSCFAKYLLPPAAAKPEADGGKGGAKPEVDGGKGGAAKGEDQGAAAAAPPEPAAAPPEPPPSAAIAVRAAIKALGRTSWRSDMEIVRFLNDFRSPQTIPALIEVLQRFKDHPEEVQSGVLSGLLLHRAHETLVAMTGAVFPADAPEKWREFWEREKDRIQVAKRSDKPAGAGHTVVQSFCGIPVEGTRVLFIVDLSRSMTFAMKPPRQTGIPDKVTTSTRLDFAKKQLTLAINEMPAITRLNFITYCGKPDAEVWSKEMQVANVKNKKLALQFVEKMDANHPPDSPDGGTNMWAGLTEGLKLKSLIYGDRYETSVDEIFLVSDGAPSAGEVQDPLEILRLVTETNRFSKVRINTIFITSPNDQDPRNLSLSPSEFMRRMAEQNGGKFVEFKE